LDRIAERRGRIDAIQYLRGAAALFVLFYHASIYLKRLRGDASFLTLFDGRFGLFGVAIFFAISGTLMAKLVRSTEPYRFLAHRIVRIFATYLAVVALYYAVAPLIGARIGVDALSIPLVPVGPASYALGVEWTLVFETTFYVALFAVAVVGLANWLETFALVWLGIILAAALAIPSWAGTTEPTLYDLPLAAANAAFIGGLLVPSLIKRGLLPPRIVVPVGLALTLSYSFLDLVANRLVGGLAATLVVGGAVQWGGFQSRPALGWALRKLGDWSYALYLCHVPVVLAVYRLAPSEWPALPLWGLAIALALLVSGLIGELDVRAYGVLRRKIDSGTPRLRKGLVIAYLVMFGVVATVGAVKTGRTDLARHAAQGVLARLDPALLRTSQSAASAITAAGLSFPGTLAGLVESTEPFGPDEAFVRGWAVDTARPTQPLWLVAYCSGRQATLVRASRMRPDIAAQLSTPEFQRSRMGFTLQLSASACPHGEPVVVIAVAGSGMAGVVPAASVLPPAPQRP
jgi:peptidoglycan/LPS O-acetylase OafA/YrhL